MSKVFNPKDIVWESSDSGSDLESTNICDHTEFEDLLNQSQKSVQSSPSRPALKVGIKITGTILMMSDSSSDVIVNLGNKSVGILPRSELTSSKIYSDLKVGDLITAVIVGKNGSEYSLSISGASSLKSLEDLKSAFANGLRVKGHVSAENKGGFDVTIFGKKAFCPISSMDRKPINNKSDYLDKDFEFIITQLEGSNIVVSRTKALLIQEKQALGELTQKINEDPFIEFNGTVSGIRDFGVFVTLDNGLEGLVHRSELSWSKVSSVSDLVQIGDKIRVKVLSISEENGRAKISLSAKSVTQDPWQNVEETIKLFQSYTGTVTKFMKFGVLIELAPGIEGFLPLNQIKSTKTIKHPSDVLQINDKIQVYVTEINLLQRKITLSSSLDTAQEESLTEWSTNKTNKEIGIFGKLLQDELQRVSKK